MTNAPTTPRDDRANGRRGPVAVLQAPAADVAVSHEETPPPGVTAGAAGAPSLRSPAVTELKVGEQLRAARERQGIPLETVARALRIPLRTLQALEEGEFSSLPADVYVRGFLSHYAGVLGLEPVPLVRAFTVERGRNPPRPNIFPWTPRERPGTGLWSAITPRRLVVVGGALGLAVVLLYVLGQVRTYLRPPRLEVLEPAGAMEVTQPTIRIRGRTDPTAEVAVNGEQAAVRDDGTFEETVSLGAGVNALRVVARSIGGRETTVVREVLSRPAPTPTPAPAAAGANNPFTLVVRAEREAVWVSLAVDGAVAFSGVLLPGSTQSVTGKRISVTSGKAAQTLIRVDGEDRGALGTSPGPIHNILFSRDSETGTIESPHGSTEVSP